MQLVHGGAVYLGLVEHPARMECGVEIAATEFPLSYRRATVIQASLAAAGLLSSIAAWLAGGELPVGHCRSTARLGHPVHADCDPADQ